MMCSQRNLRARALVCGFTFFTNPPVAAFRIDSVCYIGAAGSRFATLHPDSKVSWDKGER